MEIEKKFLIRCMPDLKQYRVKHIEQGYLCTNPVVRIRKSNQDYILTYKGSFDEKTSKEDKVRINKEMEVPLNPEGYAHLREKVDGHLIQKDRYLIPLEDGHMGELDVFYGVLEGLIFIEVEFESRQDADDFVPPAWFGENVSHDYHYSNSYLSACDDLSSFMTVTSYHSC
jgi:CYTH domain-containing protein